MRIGFFDSGIGGLSVMHRALRMLPAEEFVFYADEDHVPYGVRSTGEIVDLVDESFRFMLGLGVDAIVVACNTATSAAVREMRRRYELPIVGMEPAVKLAFDRYGSGRVLVAATRATVRGEKIERLIDRIGRASEVELVALQELVEFAERQEFESSAVREYLSSELGRYDWREYSSVVLGCTHFNYFKDTMRELLPTSVRLVDGNEGTLRELMRRMHLDAAPRGETFEVRYYYSGRLVEGREELERLDRYLRRLDRMLEIE